LSSDASDLYQIRLRKAKLAEFWRNLVQPDIEAQLFAAKTNEERAFIHLTGGDISEACAALLAGSNFHLAQMVSQIGGDKVFRETMAKQLDDWAELNISSEINDHIRAIYELLAGRTLECRSKSGPGLENRVPSFKLSARFRLDWKRAFGLRLWYGTLQYDDIATPILEFSGDLEEHGEPAKPLPWFILDKEDTGWDDPDAQSREDALWGLLKFYANQYCDDDESDGTLETLFPPENTSGNPLDPRLSFQLITLLRGRGFGDISAEKTTTNNSSMPYTSDELALEYAASLESQIPTNPDLLVVTCWTILHITDASLRTSLLKTLLDHNARLLVDNENICTALSSPSTDNQGSLRIPFAWLCASKALYARTVAHDPVAEAKWLIEGGELVQAHDVLCRVIGPTAVVEGEYDALREVLGLLGATDVRGRVDWEVGAGAYFEYVELLDLQMANAKRSTDSSKAAVKKLVKKLSGALEAVSAAGEREKSTMERIAVRLMAAKVVEIGNLEGVSLQTALGLNIERGCFANFIIGSRVGQSA
jgi:nuclear pore complex protein Nup98-Nup96